MWDAKFFLLLLILSRGAIAKLLPPNFELDPKVSLSKCVVCTGNVYFGDSKVVHFILPFWFYDDVRFPPHANKMLLAELFEPSNWSLMLSKPKYFWDVKYFDSNKIERSDIYVMQIRTVEDTLVNLNFLRPLPSWNPHAKFIIVFQSPLTKDVIRANIRALWSSNVLHGIIIAPVDESSFVYNLYTWFPFSDGDCGKNAEDIRTIGTCSMGLLNSSTDWFAKKVPDDLYGCPVKVHAVTFPPFIMEPSIMSDGTLMFRKGLEVELLKTVAATANFSIKYLKTLNVEQTGDVDFQLNMSSGLFDSLLKDQYDIGIGSLAATEQRYNVLDYTGAYSQDSITFCVPHSKDKPQWEKLVSIPSQGVILFYMLILTVSSLLMKLTTKDNGEHKPYHDLPDILVKMFAASLNNSVTRQPKMHHSRVLFIIWVCFCFFLNSGYQTYLMSCLMKPDYRVQLKHVRDLVDSDLRILVPEMHAKFQVKMFLANRTLHACKKLQRCFDRTAHARDTAVTASRMYAEFAQKRFVTRKGDPLIYCFKDNMVTYPVVMYMRKGFPLRNRISNIVDLVQEGGFLSKWITDLFNEQIKETERYDDDERTVYLRLGHVTPVFLLLAIGIFASATAFLVEIYSCRRRALRKVKLKVILVRSLLK